jgi:hypothetical protein
MMDIIRRARYVAILVTTAALMAATAGADTGREWLPLQGPQAESEALVAVPVSNDQLVEIEIDIPGLVREMTMTPAGELPRLALDPEGFTTEVGRPQLPVLHRWVEIPAGAQLRLEVVSAQRQVLSLQQLGIDGQIAPVQPPLLKVPGARETASFERDDLFYAQDRWYPQDLAELGKADQVRSRRLVPVRVHPVRYNPGRGEVSICTGLRLRIHLTGSDAEETARRQRRWDSPEINKRLGRVVINYDHDAAKDVPALPVGYLIITHGNFYNQILPLAEWKEEKGFDVTVTQLSEISPQTAFGIQTYIQDAYNTWPVPPTYVLLVGDVGYIPTFNGSSSSTETDLPYGDMTGSYLPEIEVGRFSCSTTGEASAAVNKTLDYEKTDLSTLGWFDDAVFMASLDNYTISEGTHNWVISNYMDPNGYTSTKIYARLGGGTSDITANINAGRSIANYSGHGNQTSWSNPGFGISNINALTNADMYPFVISNACLTTDLGYGECYGEHWLNVAGKGAIAHWGASNYTYWGEDDILEKRMYQAIFDDELFTFAGFTNQAKWYTYQYYGGGGMSRYYYECYILLGDPSLMLPTTIPTNLTVGHPATVPLGTTTKVIVTVAQGGSDLEDALVCLLQEGHFQQAAYTASNGEAALYITPNVTDTILVTVTAHNGRPYQGTIVPADNVPPAEVTDLSAYLAGSALMLAWSPVTTDTMQNPKTVTGYAVYRGEAIDFLPSPANSLGTTAGTDFLDTQAAVGDTGTQHYYKIVAMDGGGLKSDPSRPAGEFDRWVTDTTSPPK